MNRIGTAFIVMAGLLAAHVAYAAIKQQTIFIPCTNGSEGAFVTTTYDDDSGEILMQFGTDCDGKQWRKDYRDTADGGGRVLHPTDPGISWSYNHITTLQTQSGAPYWYKLAWDNRGMITRAWGQRADGRHYTVEGSAIYSPTSGGE